MMRMHFDRLRFTRAWDVAKLSVMTLHLAGISISALLIIAIAWTGSKNGSGTNDFEYEGTFLDMDDAETLIENADQWRQLYAINYRRSKDVEERCRAINAWLPASVDWNATHPLLLRLGQKHDLTISQVQQGERHCGTRVAVVTATCVIRGSFASLCHFLHDLSHQENPIACSEIQLQRVFGSDVQFSELKTPQCTATVTLRIPYSHLDSAAGKIVSKETQHAT